MKHHAFTLVEMLVVVAVIAALLATLTGLAMKAKKEARVLEFHAQLRRIFDDNVARTDRRLTPRFQSEYLQQIDRQVKSFRERTK